MVVVTLYMLFNGTNANSEHGALANQSLSATKVSVCGRWCTHKPIKRLCKVTNILIIEKNRQQTQRRQ